MPEAVTVRRLMVTTLTVSELPNRTDTDTRTRGLLWIIIAFFSKSHRTLKTKIFDNGKKSLIKKQKWTRNAKACSFSSVNVSVWPAEGWGWSKPRPMTETTSLLPMRLWGAEDWARMYERKLSALPSKVAPTSRGKLTIWNVWVQEKPTRHAYLGGNLSARCPGGKHYRQPVSPE